VVGVDRGLSVFPQAIAARAMMRNADATSTAARSQTAAVLALANLEARPFSEVAFDSLGCELAVILGVGA
jgi:hypothetical protein